MELVGQGTAGVLAAGADETKRRTQPEPAGDGDHVNERDEAKEPSAGDVRRFWQQCPDLFAFLGPEGQLALVNDAWSGRLGWEPGELRDRPLTSLIHPEDRAQVQDQLEVTYAPDGGCVGFEARFQTKDGRYRDLHCHAGAAGAATTVSFVGHDVTEQRGAEARLRSIVDELEHANQELEAANRSLEHFTTIASHDLRSPLATVHGLLETLARHPAGSLGATDLDLIERAMQRTARLLATVDGLLALSRVRGATVTMRPADLDHLLDEILDTLSTEMDQVDATVERGSLPTLQADPVLLRVLLQNLLSNAMKFRHPERSLVITVEVERHGDLWELSVTDNGRGFDPIEHDTIFELFGRAIEGRQHEGAGVGLATCRQIAEHHGGTIHAESLPEGSRFVVTLPAPAADQQR